MGTLGLVYFWVCAALAVFGALATISAKNPIRGAMGLLLMILCIAGLFMALHAQFLAVIQVIVYAGAIIVLFLFVIMLLGPSAVGPRDRRGFIARTIGGTLFGIGALVALFLVRSALNQDKIVGDAFTKSMAIKNLGPDFGGVDAIGRSMFTDAIVPFELSSALLMVAVLGAIAIARGKPIDKEKRLKQLQAEVPSPVEPMSADLPGVAHEGVFRHDSH